MMIYTHTNHALLPLDENQYALETGVHICAGYLHRSTVYYRDGPGWKDSSRVSGPQFPVRICA